MGRSRHSDVGTQSTGHPPTGCPCPVFGPRESSPTPPPTMTWSFPMLSYCGLNLVLRNCGGPFCRTLLSPPASFGPSALILDLSLFFFSTIPHDQSEGWVSCTESETYGSLTSAVRNIQTRPASLETQRVKEVVCNGRVPYNDRLLADSQGQDAEGSPCHYRF